MPQTDTDLTAELAATERLRAEIAAATDRLSEAARALEARGLGMLISETPQAAHAYRLARDEHARIRAHLADLESRIT